MSDYIERDAVLRHYQKCSFAIVKAVIAYIEALPAADVAPVVHGHFVHDGPRLAGGVDWWHCSNCGRLVSGAETRFDYCHNCGAKMDGGDDDATD